MKFDSLYTTPNQRFLIVYGESTKDILDKIDKFRDENLPKYSSNEELIKEFKTINNLSFYWTASLPDVDNCVVVVFGDLMNSNNELRARFLNHVNRS